MSFISWPRFLKQQIQPARRERKRSRRRLGVEILEERVLLSVVNWINPAGGDWGTAGNWLDATTLINHVPGVNDDAVISVVPAVAVTHSTGTDAVKSLAMNDPFTL